MDHTPLCDGDCGEPFGSQDLPRTVVNSNASLSSTVQENESPEKPSSRWSSMSQRFMPNLMKFPQLLKGKKHNTTDNNPDRDMEQTNKSIGDEKIAIKQLFTKQANWKTFAAGNMKENDIGDDVSFDSDSAVLDLSRQPPYTSDLLEKLLSKHTNPLGVNKFTLSREPLLQTLPNVIGVFENLVTLSLQANGLCDVPWSMLYLRKLEHLNLGYNEFSHVPYIITKISRLKYLNLESNNLKHIPPTVIRMWSLEDIVLCGNDELISPPVSVASRGLPAIRHYLRNNLQKVNLWEEDELCFSANSGSITMKSLLQLSTDVVLLHKIHFFSFDNVPPGIKTYLKEEARISDKIIQVAKCSSCGNYFSSKAAFEEHPCIYTAMGK